MLDGVCVAAHLRCEGAVHGGNPRWPVGRYLFADSEMQAHVQERIGAAAIRRVVVVDFSVRQVPLVLGVHVDDVRNLHLEW